LTKKFLAFVQIANYQTHHS